MNNTLNIAFCEDLEDEGANLLNILNSTGMKLNITSYTCGEDLLAEYQLRKFDLILFDIYMDGMTGIEAATEIRKIDAHVAMVFTTTSLDYALESYRLEAIKYIEKPVTLNSILPVLKMVYMQKDYIPQLLIKTKTGDESVSYNDIIYLEQSGSRYQTYLADGRTLIATGKLVAVFESLNDSSFYHCHKSFIVNFAFVKSLNKELQIFEMINGQNVHIRRDGFWKTKKAYEAFLFSVPKWGGTNEK